MTADRVDTEGICTAADNTNSAAPVLAKYSKGKQVNKLDWEENGGKISVEVLEKWLDANGCGKPPVWDCAA